MFLVNLEIKYQGAILPLVNRLGNVVKNLSQNPYPYSFGYLGMKFKELSISGSRRSKPESNASPMGLGFGSTIGFTGIGSTTGLGGSVIGSTIGLGGSRIGFGG